MSGKRRGLFARFRDLVVTGRRRKGKETAVGAAASVTSQTSDTVPQSSKLDRGLTKREVEATKVAGRWMQVVEEGLEKKTVWVNQEPMGGQVMLVREGKSGTKVGVVEQPVEAACFSHSPPDQSLSSYNARRWERFLRHYHKRFTPLLAKKVNERDEAFYRLHNDGLRMPRDHSLNRSSRTASTNTTATTHNSATRPVAKSRAEPSNQTRRRSHDPALPSK